MDPLVINVPAPLRWFLVNVLIVPRRKHQSAEAYQKVQMPGGSPLLVHTRALAQEVARHLHEEDFVVEFAMRYGNPSIRSALQNLKARGASQIIVAPLYPQYAESSFETAVVETKQSAHALGFEDRLTFQPPFYDEPGFISAWAERLRADLDVETTDHVVFSFHSLPVSHLTKFHHNAGHRPSPECCTEVTRENGNCYRAQCFATARAISNYLQLDPDDYTVSFQSRLGRAEWIGPNTVDVFQDLARRGVKRIAVACPSFVCDCLETLEEIGIRGQETFQAAGGERLQLVPCLNSDSQWAAALANLIRKQANAGS
jgi:ferrochelatase